ncbi:hypothetical protein BKA70DRAFT_1115519 [Coprinopsis sp. MPI-PUGE-AT-0042]|nr:hypothetical protein BKA70DRAFT_1115519 [Coprinopsis sp. MPI-PUGE-AT-0042]
MKCNVVHDKTGVKKGKGSRDLASTTAGGQIQGPIGFIWDHINYSCAYDAVLTILHSIWNKEPQVWGPRLCSLGPFMANVVRWFDRIQPLTLEQARDGIREGLTDAHPNLFPRGTRLTSMEHLLGKLLGDVRVARTVLRCPACACSIDDELFSLSQVTTLYPNYRLHNRDARSQYTISEFIRSIPRQSEVCCTCGPKPQMDSLLVVKKEISLIVMEVVDRRMQLDPAISLHTEGHREVNLSLRGLIYLGNAHFTSHIIDPEGRIWHHDGATTGRLCQFDGHRDNRHSMDNLWESRGKRLSYAVYAVS